MRFDNFPLDFWDSSLWCDEWLAGECCWILSHTKILDSLSSYQASPHFTGYSSCPMVGLKKYMFYNTKVQGRSNCQSKNVRYRNINFDQAMCEMLWNGLRLSRTIRRTLLFSHYLLKNTEEWKNVKWQEGLTLSHCPIHHWEWRASTHTILTWWIKLENFATARDLLMTN